MGCTVRLPPSGTCQPRWRSRVSSSPSGTPSALWSTASCSSSPAWPASISSSGKPSLHIPLLCSRDISALPRNHPGRASASYHPSQLRAFATRKACYNARKSASSSSQLRNWLLNGVGVPSSWSPPTTALCWPPHCGACPSSTSSCSSSDSCLLHSSSPCSSNFPCLPQLSLPEDKHEHVGPETPHIVFLVHAVR